MFRLTLFFSFFSKCFRLFLSNDSHASLQSTFRCFLLFFFPRIFRQSYLLDVSMQLAPFFWESWRPSQNPCLGKKERVKSINQSDIMNLRSIGLFCAMLLTSSYPLWHVMQLWQLKTLFHLPTEKTTNNTSKFKSLSNAEAFECNLSR